MEDFSAFVTARYGALVRRAYLLTGDVEAARDVVQSALERLYPRWKRLRDPATAEPYLQRTMLNLALNRRRRARRVSPATQAMAVDPVPGIDQRLDIAQALRRLSPIQRAALVLRYLDDRSVQEVARLLECSESAVKTHTQRALVRLRTAGALIDAERRTHDRT